MSNEYTAIQALDDSIAIWNKIAETGCSKQEAIDVVFEEDKHFVYACPLCEYTYLTTDSKNTLMDCKAFCPAWEEFNENSLINITEYPCEKAEGSPYKEWTQGFYYGSFDDVKISGKKMVALLQNAKTRHKEENCL